MRRYETLQCNVPETIQTADDSLPDTVAQVEALIVVAQADEYGRYVL